MKKKKQFSKKKKNKTLEKNNIMNAVHFCLFKNQETSFERCLSKIKQLVQTPGPHYFECDNNLTSEDYNQLSKHAHAVISFHDMGYVIRSVVTRLPE